MSSDEEDQAIGRLTRDYKDASRRLVALQAEAAHIGKVVQHLGQRLTFPKPGLPSFPPESLAKLNADKILSLVTDIDATWTEVEDIKVRLAGVGLVPAPSC
jgi:predicted component of type VI protein secretion system